jgi:hypothetical protein
MGCSMKKLFFAICGLSVALVAMLSLLEPAKPQSEQSTAAGAEIDKSDAAQEQRHALIQKLIDNGVFQKHGVPGNTPRVWVRPAFYELDFEEKQKFVSVVYAYYHDGLDSMDMVIVYDANNNKSVGTFTTAGLRMN